MLIAIFAVFSARAEDGDRRILVGTAGFDFTPTIVACAILTEAYAKIGCRADFAVFPPNRMIASLDSGEIDALILAEARFVEDYPDAILLDTPLWVDELVAFSKRILAIRNWESLKPYRIGYITGMLIIEQNLSRGFNGVPAQNPVQLFRMLDADRTDVVVTSRTIGNLMIARLNLADVIYQSEAFETVPNYHLLAKKNQDLAKRLSAVLADMAKSGRIAEITEETLVRLFPEGVR